MKTAAAILAAHAAALPAAANLDSVKAALEALPPGRSPAALATNEIYFTFEAGGLPLVTLQRPRMIGGDGLYSLALTDGREVAFFDRCPTVRRVYEAVYSYLRAGLPADCDAAEELESYLFSFDANMTLAAESAFPTFRASALTRCARWARRVALARAYLPGVESGPVGPDWTPALPAESFYAQTVAEDGTPGPFAFGATEEAARLNLARMAEEAPAPDCRACVGSGYGPTEGACVVCKGKGRATEEAQAGWIDAGGGRMIPAPRAPSLGVDLEGREGRAPSLGVKAAEAGIRAARRMIEAPAGLGLAPVTPALESPLVPFAPGASRVALAIARGYDPARLIAGDFGPRARVFVGGF